MQQYPMNQNGDLDVCSDVANQLAASTQPASVLASALGTLPQVIRTDISIVALSYSFLQCTTLFCTLVYFLLLFSAPLR